MKVLCKEDFEHFVKDQWYEILNDYCIYSEDDNHIQYFCVKYHNGSKYFRKDFFSQCFYTIPEVRKIKLDKLKII